MTVYCLVLIIDVFDFDRLVKGDGEILEEIVSKERHNEINKVCH